MGIKDNNLVSPQKVPDTTLQPTKDTSFASNAFAYMTDRGSAPRCFYPGVRCAALGVTTRKVGK